MHAVPVAGDPLLQVHVYVDVHEPPLREYPASHDAHLAPSLVQSDPVAGDPLSQVHVFCAHEPPGSAAMSNSGRTPNRHTPCILPPGTSSPAPLHTRTGCSTSCSAHAATRDQTREDPLPPPFFFFGGSNGYIAVPSIGIISGPERGLRKG